MPRPPDYPPTLPAHAEKFLDDVAKPGTPTWKTYHTALLAVQRFAAAKKYTNQTTPLPPDRLSATFLADFYTWLRGFKHPKTREVYSNATIRLYLATALKYLGWLEADGKLPDGLRTTEMQAALKKKTGRRGSQIRPERRSADEAIGALLDYYRNQLAALPETSKRQRLVCLRNHALLQTLYATAGRAAEVVSIQRGDLNRSGDGFATIKIIGKGQKERTLILPDYALAAIDAYLAARDDPSRYLFVSHGPSKTRPITTQTLWRIVNTAAKAVFGAELPRHVGPHAFRHLRAQHLVDEGIDLPVLQALLGHASIATTRDIYAPGTPVDKIKDQLATYGREPAQVIRNGERALRRERDSR